MIEQSAVVVSIEPGYAWILPQQKAASRCGACTSKSGCPSASPLELWRKEPYKMRVMNPLYARPGDKVVVGMQGDALVVYSLLAYLLPLLSLLVFAALGSEVFPRLGLGAELGSVLAGVGGLLGGLKFSNLFSERALKSDGFQPVILRYKDQLAYATPALHN